MIIDIELIGRRLYSNQSIRQRIVRDYSLNPQSNADDFIKSVIQKLEQHPRGDVLTASIDNRNIFRAAVRAIGSNSRSWSSFVKNEKQIEETLLNFEYSSVNQAAENGTFSVNDLADCLPGQTKNGDAKAIIKWAEMLERHPNCYDQFKTVAAYFRAEFDTHGISKENLLLAVVSFYCNPTISTNNSSKIFKTSIADTNQIKKLPGMQFALVSEFFRNLGWDGFKPDRHIQRLFKMWCPIEDREVLENVQKFCNIFGTHSRDVREFLYYSLLGRKLSPAGIPISIVDNMVWLLGSYVEKKGKESKIDYIKK